MSWHPNDLVSDTDLTDYESQILTNFSMTNWTGRRTKALEDWLFPILKGRGFDPNRLRTRAEVDKAFAYTGAIFADVTSAAQNSSADDLNLATTFTTPGTDALYLGSAQPFRGLFVRMLDNVSAVASVLTVSYWEGTWKALSVSNGTSQVSGKTFSGGGSVIWTLPTDWVTRVVNGSDLLYWVKLTVSATPTGAKSGQIGAIRTSALRAPATFRTLQLIFQEAPTAADGPWREKAAFYKDEADLALQRALVIVGGEFDSDASDEISDTESQQTTDQVSGGGWVLERA
jgi:hypothetical protein